MKSVISGAIVAGIPEKIFSFAKMHAGWILSACSYDREVGKIELVKQKNAISPEKSRHKPGDHQKMLRRVRCQGHIWHYDECWSSQQRSHAGFGNNLFNWLHV
ncbi:MAG: hypothetical protein ACYCY1_01850 [Sulfuriferula sp.]